jgi:hypothetical protein
MGAIDMVVVGGEGKRI